MFSNRLCFEENLFSDSPTFQVVQINECGGKDSAAVTFLACPKFDSKQCQFSLNITLVAIHRDHSVNFHPFQLNDILLLSLLKPRNGVNVGTKSQSYETFMNVFTS